MPVSDYRSQVEMLLRVLPHVAREECFALKGGTAINLFVRQMPRLSVDIDLTYVPLADRETSLREMRSAMARIGSAVENAVSGSSVIASPRLDAPKCIVQTLRATVKIEPNSVMRGTLHEPSTRAIAAVAQDEFGAYVEASIVSLPDLYAGKIVAALDRQHPRDLFDVKLMLSHEGLTPEIRSAAVVYVACSARPMAEILAPSRKPLSQMYAREFRGMTRDSMSLEDLVEAREEIITRVTSEMTMAERRFLLTLKGGEPQWDLLPYPNLSRLPALEWKLANVRRLAVANPGAHRAAVEKLRAILEI